MKRNAAVLVALVVLLTSLSPFSRSLAAAAPAVEIAGPALVRSGEEISITVSADEILQGVSAEVKTRGLIFRGVSSGMCESHGLILLPLMGQASVTYSYDVDPEAWGSVSFMLENLQLGTGTASVPADADMWTAPIAGRAADPDTANPAEPSSLNAALRPAAPTAAPQMEEGQLPAAVPDAAGLTQERPAPESMQSGRPLEAPSAGGLRVDGPKQVFVGDTFQIVLSLENERPCSGAISADGLIFVRCSSALCSPSRFELMPAAGLDCAVYTFRAAAAAGAEVSVRVGEAAEWTAEAQVPKVTSVMDGLEVLQTVDGADGIRIEYDLHPGEQFTRRNLAAALGMPSAWTLEVRSEDGRAVERSSAMLSTGQYVGFRNPEQSEVVQGRLILRGDLAGSGRLDVAQAVLLARLLTGSATAAPYALAAGDLNRNGRLDVNDLTQLAARLSA
ncbi:MAG: hypothetical protein HDQ87_06710 [Clostridia bacterium]|nr:hypothetical protein [Clostridia bacterium]